MPIVKENKFDYNRYSQINRKMKHMVLCGFFSRNAKK